MEPSSAEDGNLPEMADADIAAIASMEPSSAEDGNVMIFQEF